MQRWEKTRCFLYPDKRMRQKEKTTRELCRVCSALRDTVTVREEWAVQAGSFQDSLNLKDTGSAMLVAEVQLCKKDGPAEQRVWQTPEWGSNLHI